MSKRETAIITLIVAFAVIVGVGSFSSLGYDYQEFDYASGKIRIRHRVLGVTFSTKYQKTWIEQYAPSDPPSEWMLMGYRNAPFAPQIGTKAANLYSLIDSIGTALDHFSADEPTRRLVADYVFMQLDRSLSSSTDFEEILDELFCFGDVFPYQDDLSTMVTYDQILQAINNCTTPSQPSTISP